MAVQIKAVPDEDHLMRFVPKKEQIRDAETDEFQGIATTAFKLRESDNGGVSVTWIEYYGDKQADGCKLAADAFRENLESKKVGKTSCFAVGRVDKVKSVSKAYGKQVRVVHAPDGANPGHVELRQFNDQDRRLLDAFADEVFTEHLMTQTLIP